MYGKAIVQFRFQAKKPLFSHLVYGELDLSAGIYLFAVNCFKRVPDGGAGILLVSIPGTKPPDS